jgi:hypothetical protein
MATSVRLDPKTEQVLARLARRGGKTKSAILREAVLRLADAPPDAEAESPFDTLTRLGLIGCIGGGGTDLSTDTGRKVREVLARRGGARAPRPR